MANADRPNGCRPYRLLSGSPYNGQMTKFYTDTDCFLGDIMIQDAAGVAGDGVGYQGVTRATSATATLAIGVVVGWQADPDALSRGYHAGSSTLAVYISTDPNIVYAMQHDGSAAIAAADIGLNYDLVVTAGDTTTGVSNMEIKADTAGVVDADTPIKLVGFVDAPDNEVGANALCLVTLNTHVYNADVGSLGV